MFFFFSKVFYLTRYFAFFYAFCISPSVFPITVWLICLIHIYYRLLNNLILKGNIMEKLPAYKKCYNKLKSDIDNNVYPIGSYLPTEDELGKMFSVSRTTVRHAIDLLVKDKRIKVKQGAGTQVINPKERELTSFSKRNRHKHSVSG